MEREALGGRVDETWKSGRPTFPSCHGLLAFPTGTAGLE